MAPRIVTSGCAIRPMLPVARPIRGSAETTDNGRSTVSPGGGFTPVPDYFRLVRYVTRSSSCCGSSES